MESRFRYYVCRSMRLLTYLLKKGYIYIRVDKDRKNPKYHVWLFEDTPELREEIDRYYKNNSR